MMSTIQEAARGRRVGTGILLREAADRVQLPLAEIIVLIRRGVVFSLDGLVSPDALPLLEERRVELLRRNQPSPLGRNVGPVIAGRVAT